MRDQWCYNRFEWSMTLEDKKSVTLQLFMMVKSIRKKRDELFHHHAGWTLRGFILITDKLRRKIGTVFKQQPHIIMSLFSMITNSFTQFTHLRNEEIIAIHRNIHYVIIATTYFNKNQCLKLVCLPSLLRRSWTNATLVLIT